MFKGWDSYFLLIGGAAGALIGLLFVVASLPTGLERETRMRGASLYMSPLVFNFAVVVVISGAALAPRLGGHGVGLLVGACALVGVPHMAYVSWEIGSPTTPAPPHWSDVWCYGAAPAVLYLALAVGAAGAMLLQPWACDVIGGVCMLLLLVTVRNAWDLVTWMTPRADSKGPAGDEHGAP